MAGNRGSGHPPFRLPVGSGFNGLLRCGRYDNDGIATCLAGFTGITCGALLTRFPLGAGIAGLPAGTLLAGIAGITLTALEAGRPLAALIALRSGFTWWAGRTGNGGRNHYGGFGGRTITCCQGKSHHQDGQRR